MPGLCAMLATAEIPHLESSDLELLQHVAGPEPGKTVVPPGDIRKAIGADLDAWILAGQVEHDSFLEQEAVVEATAEERAAYGKRPLPMLNVWSRTDDDHRKCRSCIAGNFQELDPAAQRWTAQAEPSSIFAAAKTASLRGWKISKLDVKGAFLNAPLPEDELILVQPPAQWVAWGIVGKDVVWKLRRAVYGLRQSPKWWSDERDGHLRKLTATIGSSTYCLQQNEADSQVWSIIQTGQSSTTLGLICVYVDDFLLLAPEGPVRDGIVQSLTSMWKFGAERVLSTDVSLTFLGIDWFMHSNGDIYLSQERFTKELLEKHGMTNCKPVKAITMDKPPHRRTCPQRLH